MICRADELEEDFEEMVSEETQSETKEESTTSEEENQSFLLQEPDDYVM